MKSQISRREFTKTCAISTFGMLTGISMKDKFDIIIKNGLVIDGNSSQPIKKDIGIIGETITAIENLNNVNGKQIINAESLVVSPGFIDIHSHTDLELLVNPKAESKILQGVTTEVSGNCGYSPFPLNKEDFMEFNKNIIEKYDIHVNWRDITGFMQAIEEKKISINYATFTGHGDLRAFVVGKNDIQATAEQLKAMKKILIRSLKNGSFGLSSGLEYSPGSYASTEELTGLCKVVARNKGIYATHMRNEANTVEEAIDEALKIAKESNVSLQISHLKACNRSNWPKVGNMLNKIEQSARSGLPVSADRYPYIAYGTGLTVFLPLWSRQGSRNEILSRLKDKSQLPKIKKHAEDRGRSIGGWGRVVISFCFTDKNKKWEGKSIQECAEQTSKEPFEFIRTLLLEEKNRVSIIGFAMNENNLKKILSSPSVMIGSDGSAVASYGKLGKGKPHPRFYGTFPRVLGKYCRQEKYFDLVTAIKKMTSMPAEKLGLKRRGIISKGNYADITVFDPKTVIDNATFVNPHQTPTGIEYVIINGKLAVKKGKHINTMSGQVLRHGG